jgi:DnaA-homolog protein
MSESKSPNCFQQLPLNIQFRDTLSFENFFPGDNQLLLSALQNLAHVYIWGKKGAGKTHLLIAKCHQAKQKNLRAVYLPFNNLDQLNPKIFEGLELQDLVCLDDLHCIAGLSDWEEALFHFYNRAFSQGTHLVFSATFNPKLLAFNLADLSSRLSAMPSFQLNLLSEEEKVKVLKQKALNRGLEISDQVASYLLSRHVRDLSTLIHLLDRLDKAALANQRKLTIPFIRMIGDKVMVSE